METSILPAAQWTVKPAGEKTQNQLLAKWNGFVESQAGNKTLWFMVSLVFQGVFFLPLPAFLIYYFSAPVFVLGITLTLFFANIIAGMGGAGIRTLLYLFAASTIIHLLMTFFCTI